MSWLHDFACCLLSNVWCMHGLSRIDSGLIPWSHCIASLILQNWTHRNHFQNWSWQNRFKHSVDRELNQNWFRIYSKTPTWIQPVSQSCTIATGKISFTAPVWTNNWFETDLVKQRCGWALSDSNFQLEMEAVGLDAATDWQPGWDWCSSRGTAADLVIWKILTVTLSDL